MSFYHIDISGKIEIDRTVKYECENCGQISSYTQTHLHPINESGQTAGKQSSEAKALTKQLNQKVQRRAQAMINVWSSNKPEFDLGTEKCPNCGYLQSWMQDERELKAIQRFIVYPIGIMSVILFFSYFFAGNFENRLIDFVRELACLAGFGLWVVLGIIFFLIGIGLVYLLNPNRKFGEVEKTNEPEILWSEARVSIK